MHVTWQLKFPSSMSLLPSPSPSAGSSVSESREMPQKYFFQPTRAASLPLQTPRVHGTSNILECVAFKATVVFFGNNLLQGLGASAVLPAL